MKLELKIPPPIVALIIAGAMWLNRESGLNISMEEGFKTMLTVTIVVIGGALDFCAFWVFMRAKTTVDPINADKASALVVSGVYRYSRNPMYVGNFIFLLAWIVWLGAPTNVIFLIAYVGYINQFQIKPEERILSQKFGHDYDEFCSNVRRWL